MFHLLLLYSSLTDVKFRFLTAPSPTTACSPCCCLLKLRHATNDEGSQIDLSEAKTAKGQLNMEHMCLLGKHHTHSGPINDPPDYGKLILSVNNER